MVKPEVVIDEGQCQGCGYCVKFCPRGCIVIAGDKFTPKGYMLASFVKPDGRLFKWARECSLKEMLPLVGGQ